MHDIRHNFSSVRKNLFDCAWNAKVFDNNTIGIKFYRMMMFLREEVYTEIEDARD